MTTLAKKHIDTLKSKFKSVDPSCLKRKHFCATLTSGGSTSTGLWILYMTTIYPTKFNHWTKVPTKELLTLIENEAMKLKLSAPKATNFYTLNNMVKSLKKVDAPLLTHIQSNIISLDPIIFTPEFQQLIKDVWKYRELGYFDSPEKNKAHTAEIESANQKNVYGVNDHGIDHIIEFNGNEYATDYKDFTLGFDLIRSLIINRPSPFFCIRSKGLSVFNNNGQFSEEFISFCNEQNLHYVIINEPTQTQLFISPKK